MEDTIAEKLATIAENEQNVFNAGYEKGLASGGATINNQDKTITENGVYQADEGYTGLGTVTVEVASTGGGDIDAFIDGSITEVTSNTESIVDYAFYGRTLLKTVNFPLATRINGYAFQGCQALKTVDFPLVTNIYPYAFQGCKALETVDFPLVRGINQNAFEKCQALKTVNFPLITAIGNNAFENCQALKTVDFPLVTSVGTGVFYNCLALETVYLPLVTMINTYTFYKCGQLKTVDLPLVTSIGNGAFNGCQALSSLIIRSEKMCTLVNTAAFTNSSIASGTGYIYVPKDLAESYKAATNWSTYATQFRALEDYTVDGTVNGELDESKI